MVTIVIMAHCAPFAILITKFCVRDASPKNFTDTKQPKFQFKAKNWLFSAKNAFLVAMVTSEKNIRLTHQLFHSKKFPDPLPLI